MSVSIFSIDWFPLTFSEDRKLCGTGHATSLYNQTPEVLPVVTENKRFLVLKSPGRQHTSGLMGRSYSPAHYQVWEKDETGGHGRIVIKFEVRQ